MNDESRKRLTEYLGECWHISEDSCAVGKIKLSGGISIQTCYKCKVVMSDSYHIVNENRTFDTYEDFGALKDKLCENGEWKQFVRHCDLIWWGEVSTSEVNFSWCSPPFSEWLFRPESCALVDEYLKSKVDFVKWLCLDCRWIGSRHETNTNFLFSILCPECGSHRMEAR